MHFIVSWDIPNTASRLSQEERLVQCFAQHPYVKPLTTFYIVQVPDDAAFQAVRLALNAAGQQIPQARLVCSPLMVGGRYSGLLLLEEWANLNKLSA